MDQENIMFSKNQDKSYIMTDLYLNHNISFGYKDFYNYYDIDVDKILLLKKSRDEYFLRYNDVNKMKIVSLQLKIETFHLCELHMFTSGITLVPIESDDEDFLEIDDYGDEFIMLEIEKNTSAIRDKNRNDLVFVFISAFNNILQASLVQYRY